MKRLLPLLCTVALLGLGCAPKPPNGISESVAKRIPDAKTANNVNSLPCLLFSQREGFAQWLDAYDAGKPDATKLAQSAKLPATSNSKLTADMRQSLNTGANPTFVCALDDQGKNVVWITEPQTTNTDCRDMYYVSLDGVGTVSEIGAPGRKNDCSQLCKPKRQEADLLVWQCDLRQGASTSSWSQLNMERKTGKVDVMSCTDDGLGLTPGCVK